MQLGTPTIINCADCAKQRAVKPTTKGAPRTPAGWKRRAEQFYCNDCWEKRYILRAISMPVSSPLDCSWEELRKTLKVMWQQTTACANRIMTECYARDVRRNGEDKMLPMPPMYLYPDLRAEFPSLPPQTVASLEHTCQRKYRAARFKVVWTAAAALPTYRYPMPFPIPNLGWSPRIEEDRPIVSFRVGEQRIDLRLKSGPQYRRQYEQFRLITRGEAIKSEAAIYQAGDALMVKLVAWLPRQEQKERSGVLRVHTAADTLLVAVNAQNKELWRYNGDHLRRWAAEHRRALQRWSEDAKYENRPLVPFADRRAAATSKFHDRMSSATHEIAAQLAGYADRRRFAAVEYDDSERGFCEQLPWHRLRTLITTKLDARGIEFVTRGPAYQESPEPLSDDGDENQ